MEPRAGLGVGLFVTCLADLMRPSVAFAAVKLLQDAGCEVVVPPGQTCCGQPALNSGDSTVLGGDLGCLLNIAGRLKRRGLPVRVLHAAEVLAGMGAQPAIGEPEQD